ncbi:ABC transporter permease [Candidatus Acetothermia bacterium]|nr:ABC transporter permease [Candidatus Acetothermia bacterium]MBI3460678.1 ABC transporter permease [Candidatus Acetothermia bacterium]MBI3659344.1 ABC transporter permease [Candidatus Acetothermia bacterium]
MNERSLSTTTRATVPIHRRATLWDRLLEPVLGVNACFIYVFLYMPIVVLIAFSFSASPFSAVWGGFSIDWYIQLFQDSEIARALRNTLIVASFSMLFATIIGTMTALALSKFQFRGRNAFETTLNLPIVIPDIVQGISLLMFLVLVVHLALGLPTIIIAHTVFNISYVAVIVRARLHGFDRRLEEAAMDLGATEWQTFWKITFPLIWPGILSGALLAFTLSLDEFVVTFFVTGPGATTLPIQVYSMVKRGVTPEINALATLMLVASILLVTLSILLQRRRSS